MRTIGKWFPESDQITYRDDQSDQLRADNPDLILTSSEVIGLRRQRFWVTETGQQAVVRVKQLLATEYCLDLNAISVHFNVHCGCSCSCSPGFDFQAEVSPEVKRQHMYRRHALDRVLMVPTVYGHDTNFFRPRGC